MTLLILALCTLAGLIISRPIVRAVHRQRRLRQFLPREQLVHAPAVQRCYARGPARRNVLSSLINKPTKERSNHERHE